jgi:hypothetical protein
MDKKVLMQRMENFKGENEMAIHALQKLEAQRMEISREILIRQGKIQQIEEILKEMEGQKIE